MDRPAKVIPTLGQAAAAWWQTKSAHRSSDQLLSRVNLAAELVGRQKPVNEITFADVQSAIQKRRAILTPSKKPPANATVNRDLIATLRPTIKLAEEMLNDGVGQAIPFPRINWGKLALAEPKPAPKGLSASESDAFMTAVPANLHEFVGFMRRYGPRISEMFFHPDEVDVDGCRVRLRNRKAGDDHVIPILKEDAAMLAARISRAKAAGLDTVWYREVVEKKTGKVTLVARTLRGVGKALSEAATESGLRDRGVKGSHTLRHTAATNILRSSSNVRVAQRLLGHASLQSTLVYAHALEDDLRAALDKLSQPVPEPKAAEVEDTADKPSKSQKKV